MEEEQQLVGGRTTPGVVRVGDTVRRPRGHRAGFVTAALVWLNEHGFQYAPGYLGVDAQGRDVLEYRPGSTTDHPSQRHEGAYADIASILRQLHTLTVGADFLEPESACLIHGDPGPYNTIMGDGRPTTLIDWDSARPGDPIEDVGYAAWTWCVQAVGNVPLQDQARRLRQFRDAYDPLMSGRVFLNALLDQQERLARVESRMTTDTNCSEARRRHATEAVQWATNDASLVREHWDVFMTAMSR
ncbi:phosphotransferase family protein [Calidifontibacter indicus]|uniref:phosphotransferase family protein n=1 Tax=Calidifontibacter indicus TaxID=419650 RepID=UPI003D73D7D6